MLKINVFIILYHSIVITGPPNVDIYGEAKLKPFFNRIKGFFLFADIVGPL